MDIYQIQLLNDDLDHDVDGNPIEYNEQTAYIDNGYFYIYRGDTREDPRTAKSLKPGIYRYRKGKDVMHVLVPVTTDEEKEEYDVNTHINSLNPVSVIDTAKTKEELLVAIPESTKIFQPTLSENDDILKRLAKMALIAKNVDLDRYKDRFTNKNELFNFKQVIKGDNKLSILIFNRGMSAMNLEYDITLREKDPANAVGDPLKEPITISSDDTYPM